MNEPKPAEERMSLMVEASPNAIMLVDAEGTIVSVNTQAEKLFGYGRTEMLGQKVEMLVPKQFRARHPDMRRAFSNNPIARPMGTGRDLCGLRKDGTEVPIEIGLSLVKTHGETLVLVSIIDITERKHAQEALTRE